MGVEDETMTADPSSRQDRTEPSRPPDADTQRAVLLFSGGVDSTMAACQLADAFERVDLVSYENGYGHYRIRRTARRARELERHYPGRFHHTILSVRDLFEALVLDSLHEDYDRYGSGFIWCMGCKLAMHTRTIARCLAGGVRVVADGSSSSTTEMVEQMPASIDRVKAFYAEYGIRFENPVYDMAREDSIRALRGRGFRMGFRIGDRFLGTQPKCKPGELYYMPYLLLDRQPDHRASRVLEFIDAKLVLARRWIEEGVGA